MTSSVNVIRFADTASEKVVLAGVTQERAVMFLREACRAGILSEFDMVCAETGRYVSFVL
jgi:hypothetical protein